MKQNRIAYLGFTGLTFISAAKPGLLTIRFGCDRTRLCFITLYSPLMVCGRFAPTARRRTPRRFCTYQSNPTRTIRQYTPPDAESPGSLAESGLCESSGDLPEGVEDRHFHRCDLRYLRGITVAVQGAGLTSCQREGGELRNVHL